MTAFPRGSAPHGVASAEILRVRALWPLLAIAGTAYAVVACILGLWAGPYLFDMHGLDPAARGAVIIWIPIGMMLGNLLISPLDRVLDTRKRIIVTCALATVAILVVLAAVPRPPLLLITVSFALIGFVSAYTTLIIAHGRGFYSDRQMGRGVTVVNTAVLLGAGILQGRHRPHCRRAGAGRREPASGHLPRHLRHARRGPGVRPADLPPLSGRAAERGRGSGTAAVRHCRIGVVP